MATEPKPKSLSSASHTLPAPPTRAIETARSVKKTVVNIGGEAVVATAGNVKWGCWPGEAASERGKRLRCGRLQRRRLLERLREGVEQGGGARRQDGGPRGLARLVVRLGD